MCGRGACALSPDCLSRACEYKDNAGKRRIPSWTKSELEYVPSYNIGPRDVVPCVVAGSHFDDKAESVLCSMMWGMIPPWHQGEYKKHTLSTHNARLENIQSSKLYAPALRHGKRCLVIFEGYYEWKAGKTKKDAKQPYYIYASQSEGVRVDDPTTWKDDWCKDTGWQGIKVLKMAGIFNEFKTVEGKIIYSCTIITTDSNSVLSWLHHRVPVFLQKDEDARAWLSKDVSITEAINGLKKLTLSEGTLACHTVSTLVNNVLHKSEDCRKETKAAEEKKSRPNDFMASWLRRGTAQSAKRKSTSTDEQDMKIKEVDEKPLKAIKRD